MKEILLIINGPAYGADETFNAARLAGELARHDDAGVRVFLMGDAVTCAISGQKTPEGYYSLDRMLVGFAQHGGRIACCGTCMDARGLTGDRLIDEASRSTMDELAGWTVAHGPSYDCPRLRPRRRSPEAGHWIVMSQDVGDLTPCCFAQLLNLRATFVAVATFGQAVPVVQWDAGSGR